MNSLRNEIDKLRNPRRSRGRTERSGKVMDARTKALTLVDTERNRQNAKWGDQSGNHPFEWMSILGEEYGELCEAVNETCFQNGINPEKGGTEKIIKEASHVAAVAVAIMEAALAGKGAEE